MISLLNTRGSASTNLLIAMVAIVALSIGLILNNRANNVEESRPEFKRVILLPTPRVLSPFVLSTDTERQFTNESLNGKWSLFFFGFTHCPDICPTTLLTLKNLKSKLSAQGLWPDLNVFMVSVDPQRDDVKRLNQYVRYFDKEFVGITGEEAALERFAKELGILFVKREPDAAGYYQVDHGVSLILTNDRGEYAGVVTAPHEGSVLEEDFATLHRFLDGSESGANVKKDSVTDDATTGTKPSNTAEVTIRDAWIRLSPPQTPSNAGYLSLNNGASDLTITGVESPAFDLAMIHSTTMEDGMAQMVHIDSITLTPNEQLEFAPMGHHLMLVDANRPILAGELIPITLKTSMGDISFIATVSAEAPIESDQN